MSQEVKISARKLLALNIIKLRKSANINKENLSLALGLDNSYISKLEKEKINITIDKLEAIANYFNVEVSALLK